MKVSGFLVSFMRVVGSTVLGDHSAVLVGGDGAVGGLGDDESDAELGERMEDVEMYSALGVIARPRPPETPQGTNAEIAAEAMAARTSSGLVPIAWRDLRLNRMFPAPKPGTTALVGYGGGFLAFDDGASAQKNSLSTLYVPYARNGSGVPQKAHVIALNPDTESIHIIHGDGYAIVLDKDNGITMRADSTTWLSMKPGEFTVVASKIVLQGNVALGANPTTGVPLLPGPASPPCPSLFVSSV